MVRFILQVRCVDGRLNRQVQSFLFYICHNPDDLTKARGTSCVPTCSDIVHADLLADWILSRPVGFRQCLIQDHDGRWSGRKPGSRCSACSKLRKSKPAAMDSTTARQTSETSSKLERCPAIEALPFRSVFNLAITSRLEDAVDDASASSNPVKAVMKKANNRA